ncbi:pilus assembly protein TadG-related protein [Cellulomonas sp. URHE0023]|uniref:pilus assembly protein TadG-related protein n=1 Tax=Cellulomonas sp. URHE0023 TaxID=1380354 RepID=UPI00068AF0A6|nr:pilus assembly protein TadG-related protein [Cellulomonas sp. URHE0023]
MTRRWVVSRAEADQGTASIFVLGLIVVLFAVVGLVADGGRSVNARVAIMDNAEQAARVAANQLDAADLSAGVITIDQDDAAAAATAFLVAAGYDAGRANVEVDGNQVTVTVDDQVPTTLLQLAGIRSFTVHGEASARAALGINDELGAP